MIKLKRALSGFIVAALLSTSMAPAFAASTFSYEAQANKLNQMGLMEGVSDGAFDPALHLSLDRQTGIVMLLRLIGKADEALAMTEADATAALAKFADAKEVAEWAKKSVAYAIKNNLVNGMTDTTVAPKTNLNGKMFATLILRNLGYEVSENSYHNAASMLAEKGGLTATEAEKFNNKELIRDDLVGIAFGSLKAKDKAGKEVIANLIADGTVSQEKAVAAGVYTAPVAQGIEVTNKAKSITVKLNAAPADASKVVFTVTRDNGIAVPATFTQDAQDKAVFTYTSATNLVAGDYKVAVKNDTTDLGNKTIKVEAEKLAKIEITSKSIVRYSDFSGIAYYKATNQYGEDVTKLPIAGNITWTSSLGNDAVTADKGRLVITKGSKDTDPYMGKLRDYVTTPVVINGYDTDSNVVINSTLSVSNTVGDIQSVKILGVKDNKVIEKGSNDTFYLDYELKDSAGNIVTDYAILSNTMAFQVNPGNNGSSIAYAVVVTDPSDDKKAAIEIKLPSSNAITGTQVITAVAVGSGKSDSFSVEVKEGSELKEFVLQRPLQDVAAGDGMIQVPFIAMDANGKEIKEYSKLKSAQDTGKLNITGLEAKDIKLLQNSDGTASLWADFGSVKTTKTLTATAQTTTSAKVSMITVSIKDKSYPASISALPFDTYLLEGASTEKGFNDIKVLDNYDRPVDFKYNWEAKTDVKIAGTSAPANYEFKVEVKSTPTKFTVDTAEAYGKNKIKFTAKAGAYGSETITLALKAYPTAGGDPKEIATKSITLTNVDPKDIVSYAIESVPAMQILGDYDFSKDMYKENAQEIKVRGLLTGGQKVIVPDANILNFSVTDTTQFGVDGVVENNANHKRVYAKSVNDGQTTATAKLTATIKGYQGSVSTATTDVSSSKANPVAASLSVVFRDPGTGGMESDGVTPKYPVKNPFDVRGDVYEITQANFENFVLNKTMTKFDAAGTKADQAALFFEVKDQYGKTRTAPKVQVLDSAKYEINADNELALKGVATVGTDEIRINATRDGFTKTITIKIK